MLGVKFQVGGNDGMQPQVEHQGICIHFNSIESKVYE